MVRAMCDRCVTGLEAASGMWVCGAWETSYDAMATFSPLSQISDPAARQLLVWCYVIEETDSIYGVQMSDNKARVGGEMVVVGSKKNFYGD